MKNRGETYPACAGRHALHATRYENQHIIKNGYVRTLKKFFISLILILMAVLGQNSQGDIVRAEERAEAETETVKEVKVRMAQKKGNQVRLRKLDEVSVDLNVLPFEGNKNYSLMAGKRKGKLYILSADNKKTFRAAGESKIFKDTRINPEGFVISDIYPVEDRFYLMGYSKKGKVFIIETKNGKKYDFTYAGNLKAASGSSFRLVSVEQGFLTELEAPGNGGETEKKYYHSNDGKKWKRVVLPIEKKRKDIIVSYIGSRQGTYYFAGKNKSGSRQWQYKTEDFKEYISISFFPPEAGIIRNELGYGIKAAPKKFKVYFSSPSFDKMTKKIELIYEKGVKNSLYGYWGIFTPYRISFFVNDINDSFIFLANGKGSEFKKYHTKLKAEKFHGNGIYRGEYYLTAYSGGLIASNDGFRHYIKISLPPLSYCHISCLKDGELISGYNNEGKYVTYYLGAKEWVEAVSDSAPES